MNLHKCIIAFISIMRRARMNVHKDIPPPRLSTPLSADTHRQLKIAAVKRNVPLQQLVQDIIGEWLEKNREAAA